MSKPIVPLYADIGSRIMRVRRVRKISQLRLASMVGLSRTSMSNIEQGRQRLTIETIYRLALILDCDIDVLLPTYDEAIDLLGAT